MTIYRTLLSASDLIPLLSETSTRAPLVLDCRASLGDAQWGAAAYLESHIQGAQRLDLEVDLAGPPLTTPAAADPRPGGRHPLPDPERLTRRLRELGAHNDQQLIVYDDRDSAFAARAWWCLRWLGHEAVAVLDGGLASFAALAQEQLRGGEEEVATTGDFSVRPARTRTADVDAVMAAVSAKAQAPQPQASAPTLLDARAQARFAGEVEPIDPVAGHIDGALCRPFTENLDSDGHFLEPPALATAFAALPEPLICYCGSGVTATHNILAAVHAGLAEPALYVGSWSDWIRDPDRPRGGASSGQGG
ncbi:MAG: sulfurtransferase [Pseudomonadota bacterium]